MGTKTKIDWCDATCNFVIGCPRGCEYCYARKANDTRFHWVEDFSKPEFKPNAIKVLKSRKPKAIFMDSLSDVCYWQENWLFEVANAVLHNYQHNYIFLTKSNTRNISLTDNNGRQVVFWGKTITNVWQADDWKGLEDFDFYSIEPLLERITIPIFSNLKQVIIGAETGTRKDKVIPQKEWIDDIVKQCDNAGVRVFMKESLRKLMGADFRQDELIWAVKGGEPC